MTSSAPRLFFVASLVTSMLGCDAPVPQPEPGCASASSSPVAIVSADAALFGAAALADPDGLPVRPLAVSVHGDGFVVAGESRQSAELGRLVIGAFDGNGCARWVFATEMTSAQLSVEALTSVEGGNTLLMGSAADGNARVFIDGVERLLPPRFLLVVDDAGGALFVFGFAEDEQPVHLAPLQDGALLMLGLDEIALDATGNQLDLSRPGLVVADVDVRGNDGAVVSLATSIAEPGPGGPLYAFGPLCQRD